MENSYINPIVRKEKVKSEMMKFIITRCIELLFILVAAISFWLYYQNYMVLFLVVVIALHIEFVILEGKKLKMKYSQLGS